MGKIRKKATRQERRAGDSFHTKSKFKSTLRSNNIDYLLMQIEENMDSFNYEAAKQLCTEALHLQPDNVQALELMAGILIELGNSDEAKKQLMQTIFLAPTSGHRKYMTLAQMCNSKEALLYYEKGIEILNNTLQKKLSNQDAQNDQEIKNLQEDLSTAHCAIAELYMTDCCFDDDAETKCFENLEKSVAIDDTNIEAHQTLAGFYLVKEDKKKALESIQKSLSLWLPNFQAVREGRSNPNDLIEVCPLSYASRINAVKLLIELEDYDNAGIILEGLVEEDDEVIETWYLLGWMNFLKGEAYKNNARFYFLKCQRVADKIQSGENEILSHIQELLQTIEPDKDNQQPGRR